MKTTLIAVLLYFSITSAYAQWHIDIESGIPFQGYNTVRIPNESGTKFDFNDDFDLKLPVIPLRIQIGYTFAEKNHFFALYAPLSLNYEGASPYDIQFQETLFPQGENIDGYYKFNSYRLGYRRDILQSGNWTIGTGFTAKIRDATVRLQTDALDDRKDNIGFVPLLKLYAAYECVGWKIYLDGDGLAGGPGRAFDFFLGGDIAIGNSFDLKAGYRILEGGADVETVYNFTLIHFAVIGIVWKL